MSRLVISDFYTSNLGFQPKLDQHIYFITYDPQNHYAFALW